MASPSRFQGGRRVPAPCVRLLTALLAGACAGAGAASAATPVLCAFDRGGLHVEARDASAEGGLGVDIEISDGPLVLTRVGIPTEARALGCWQADLDADRRFELVLGLEEEAGAAPARLMRFEWTGELLESLGVAAMDEGQHRLFGGEERFEVRSNQLIRSFAARLEDGGAGPRLHFRYDVEAARWVRLQALRPAASPAAATSAPAAR
jgi:hypothetical protein